MSDEKIFSDDKEESVSISSSVAGSGKYTVKKQTRFSTPLALFLSCLGCVVGTGNIWRFPRILANNSQDEGCLVFIIVWVIFLLLWSIPILIVEYGTGRFTQKAVIGSFQELGGAKVTWCGAWICLVSFCISCYYVVILGWCFYYIIYFIANELPQDATESRKIFKDFAEDSYWPILTTGIAVLLAALSVSKGVKTIEKVCTYLVPVLLLILLFTFVWSLTREYADVGIKYMFTPHWDSFSNPRVWVDAVTQNAFDTGAGAGLLIPYAAYMSKHHGIVRYATVVPTVNNLVSLISGITIFSTVFSSLIASTPYVTNSDIVGIIKDSGPGSTGLTFIWIPVLFESVGVFGRVLACLFFLCLSLAGLTSIIASFELFTHTLVDFNLRRPFAILINTCLIFGFGMLSATNINILTNQDFVWSFALIINGFMLIILVFQVGVRNFRERVINSFGSDDWRLNIAWEWIIAVIVPLEGLAVIVWWSVDLIESPPGDEWYEFGRETFLTTIVQWLGLLILIILTNILVSCVCHWRRKKRDQEGAPVLTRYSPNYSATRENPFRQQDQANL
nr:hypothetical protein BgiMline_026088 [Biomphalaria glabrata]